MIDGLLLRRIDLAAEPVALAELDGVLSSAFGVATLAGSLISSAAAQPDGLVVAEFGRETIGVGSCIGYPDAGFGWLGPIATRPDFQRRGIGRQITQFLIDTLATHGCAAALDASESGAPVYASLGFVDFGPTQVVVGALRPGRNGRRCAGIGADDVSDVVAYDAACFGAQRSQLIRSLLERNPNRGLVARSRTGTVTGYAIAQGRSLAPVVADDQGTLIGLLQTAESLERGKPWRIDVPPDSTHFSTLMSLGFTVGRELRHMRRGIESLPGHRFRIAGQAGLGQG